MGLTGLHRPASARLAGVLAALALSLSACSPALGQSSSTTSPRAPKGYELKTNSTVTIGVRALPTNFNPSSPAGDNRITQMVMAQVWPQPFVTSSSFELVSSDLLVSAEVHSVSPLEVVYVINPKATWSNGTPITASDFIYDWQQHLLNSASLPDAGLVAGYRDISSISGTDEGRTVTVEFKQPFSQWQELFSYLAPSQVGEQYGWSRGFAGFSPSKVLSGGPFEISSFRPGRELTLSRNPQYWGPAANVAHIRFVVEHSGSAMLSGLSSGALSLAEMKASAPNPGVLGAGSVGMKGARAPSGRQPLSWSGTLSESLWQLCFNFNDPLTADISIRRGVEHAIDRSEIVADSEGLVDPRAHVAVSRLLMAGETSGAGSSPVERAPDLYRPAAALAAFRAAGYSIGTGGLMRAGGTGPPLVIDLLEPRGNWAVDQAGLVVQSELGAIGVTVKITKTSLGEMLTRRLPEGAYEMALAPFATGPTVASLLPEYSNPVVPPHFLTSPSVSGGLPGSPSASAPGPSALWRTQSPRGREPGALAAGAVTRDVMGFDSAQVDNYFAKALAELNPPAALSYLARAEKVLWREVVTIPLFQASLELVRSGRLENVSESPTGAGPMWSAENWVIVKHLPKAANSSTTTSTP